MRNTGKETGESEAIFRFPVKADIRHNERRVRFGSLADIL
jgi:hypothetical protein